MFQVKFITKVLAHTTLARTLFDTSSLQRLLKVFICSFIRFIKINAVFKFKKV